jgi:hypothetical protein
VLVGVKVQEARPPLTGALAHEVGNITFNLLNMAVKATVPVALDGATVAVMVTGNPAAGRAENETVVVVGIFAAALTAGRPLKNISMRIIIINRLDVDTNLFIRYSSLND